MTSLTLNRQSIRRLLIAVALVVSCAVGFAAGAARQTADPRLFNAVEHLVTAKALLEASEAGELSPKAQRQYDRQLRHAMNACDNAIEAVAQAVLVSDNAQ